MQDLKKLIAKNPTYPKFVEDKIDAMRKNFEIAKHLLNQRVSDDNFNSAFQSFYEIINTIPLLKNSITIPQIARARANFNGELFTQKSEISYNLKNQHKIELGRFNRKGEPLFYGSLPVENSKVDYIMACALECCKELIDEETSPDVQDFTISGWIVEKPFDVITMCFDKKHLEKNPSLKLAVDGYISSITEAFNSDTSGFIKEFMHYFSGLSSRLCKNDNSYYVLTALFVAIRYYYKTVEKQKILGMIYPSAMTESEGLNIVLTRYAVDNFLRLDKVVMYRYYLEKNEHKYIAYPCSKMAKVIGDSFSIPDYTTQAKYLKNMHL